MESANPNIDVAQTQLTLRFEQAENLARVSRRITALVKQFVNERIGQRFTADELRRFVAEQEPTAPGSADRILRDLRQRGLLNYEVLDRAKSLYVGRPVA